MKKNVFESYSELNKEWTESPMQWTWAWENSRRWWGTGRPGMLQSMGSQRVGHNWMNEQQQQEINTKTLNNITGQFWVKMTQYESVFNFASNSFTSILSLVSAWRPDWASSQHGGLKTAELLTGFLRALMSVSREPHRALVLLWASLVAQLVKNLLAMWETWVWSLGWEDPLEKGKATHSSILAWRIPWTIIPWTEQLSLYFHFHSY